VRPVFSVTVSAASQIRSEMRRTRRLADPVERARLSRRVVAAIAASGVFHRARRVAVYLPMGGEVDLTPLIHRAISAGKRCYLPAVDRPRLRFLPYNPGTPLRRNRFGIPEPWVPARLQAPPGTLDLVLCPLVAYDPRGNRLGMGGGYYDRTFAFVGRRRHWRRPVLLGAAYAFQRVPGLDPDPWDVPLHGVATEVGVEWFGR
jgi:5-formyltetrahydrofolate cyclo-ligase